jgi:antitoxin ParD1/3/4
LNDWLREKIDESLSDPRPSIPAKDVFKRLKAHHAARSKSRK